ncbi:MAG: HAMP domain-containing histidine kinase [Clostridium sp.]|nr:HAMP domain-containing histidine kinase [Clostridium sp.]
MDNRIPVLSLRVRKQIAVGLHLLFLMLALFGIGTLYLNENLGVGITRVKNIRYEDTAQFNEQVNADLNNIFRYIKYSDTFAQDRAAAVDSRALRMMYGPTDLVDYTLKDLLAYLESRGYQIREDFSYTYGGLPEKVLENREGYVMWSIADPDVAYEEFVPNMVRSRLESTALQIMDALHDYYAVQDQLIVNKSNLHFKIAYHDPGTDATDVFTNDPELTKDNVHNYGKYAYLPGNSVFYDTNLQSITLNTIPALAANNPYEGSEFYLLLAVDTRFPEQDAYARANYEYRAMQNFYIIGFVLLVVGSLLAFFTLLYLIRMSGRAEGTKEIQLHREDQNPTEVGLLFFAIITGLMLIVGRYVIIRIAHVTLPVESWETSERAVYYAILYLGLLMAFFSMLRRYKAGILWSKSLTCRFTERMSLLSRRQSFKGRIFLTAVIYAAVNTGLILLIRFIRDRVFLDQLVINLLTGAVLFAIVLFNLWVFYLIFRHAVVMDRFVDAVGRLASGETSYKIDTSEMSFQEQALAQGLNNLSDGLEAALMEKVKSERLKADLITNVSHDIKTPLTSIINYVDLIKRENITDEKVLGYLEVLDQKSQRLKTLTEDLVEASKVSSGNVRLEMMPLNIVALVQQTNGEFEDRMEQRHLDLILHAPEEKLMVMADGRSLFRVLENVYNNVCKYALDHSRVYVDILREKASMTALQAAADRTEDGDVSVADRAVFTIKNISASQLNINPDELTERFVRGDVSRTTEGSGLGLSIAKSLTELMHGTFDIIIDGDLFKIRIAFDILEEAPAPSDKKEEPSDE